MQSIAIANPLYIDLIHQCNSSTHLLTGACISTHLLSGADNSTHRFSGANSSTHFLSCADSSTHLLAGAIASTHLPGCAHPAHLRLGPSSLTLHCTLFAGPSYTAHWCRGPAGWPAQSALCLISATSVSNTQILLDWEMGNHALFERREHETILCLSVRCTPSEL